jgi:DNA-binding response OmpR family regulator
MMGPNQKNILIVDDEKDFANALKLRFKNEGYDVDIAIDGKEALDKVNSSAPDLIILDLMLPKIDGLKLCRMIKFDERYKKIPVVMLTARSQDSDQVLGQQVGADAYFVKPVENKELLSKVKELLK